MRYEPSYQRQLFWDSEGAPGLSDVIDAMSGRINNFGNKIPSTKKNAMVTYLAFGTFAVGLLAAIITYIARKSVLLTMIVGLVSVFYAMGAAALIGLVISRTFFSRKCTEPVNAKCIGISIRGRSEHGKLIKAPVFKYAYGGRNYLAVDGRWTNFYKEFPKIGEDWEIKVDPDDPEEIEWTESKSTSIFIVLWGVGSIIMASLILWMCLQDKNFMEAALNEQPPVVRVVSRG